MQRRTFLAAAGVAVTPAIAGCSLDSDDQSPSLRDEQEDPVTGLPADATTDFDVRRIRVPGEDHVVSYREGEDGELRQHSRFFLLESADAESVHFEAAHEGVDDVREFLAATDYGETSIVVHQRRIEACYERRVEYVQIQPERYRVQFCRTLKPASTPCEAEEVEMDVLFIRIPHAYDSSPRRTGSGESSRCPGHRRVGVRS